MNLNININALVPDEDIVEVSTTDLVNKIRDHEATLSRLEYHIKNDFSKLLKLD